MDRLRISRVTEEYAAFFLLSLGYEVWDTNFSSVAGELDIIASKDAQVSFIEVRGRALQSFVRAEEAISAKKLAKVEMTALSYLREKKLEETNWQVDFLALSYDTGLKVCDLSLIENVTGL